MSGAQRMVRVAKLKRLVSCADEKLESIACEKRLKKKKKGTYCSLREERCQGASSVCSVELYREYHYTIYIATRTMYDDKITHRDQASRYR